MIMICYSDMHGHIDQHILSLALRILPREGFRERGERESERFTN